MSIQRTEPSPGYPVLEINHATARARVALHGAHILEWQPAGQLPVLYLSPQSLFQEGKAIRGGVPLCWPWFGAHEKDRTLPSHGFARTRFWNLASTAEDQSGVTLRFSLTDDEKSRKLWPHAFRLEMEMRIGKGLHLALHMTNSASEPFSVSGALHTYLVVGDIRNVRLTGLDGAEYIDTVGTPQLRRQSGDVVFDREVDRGYFTTGDVKVIDRTMNRVITVRGHGSGCRVIWNPWIDKSKILSDLPDADYLRLVCVETANAWKDSVVVAPGESHALGTTITVNQGF